MNIMNFYEYLNWDLKDKLELVKQISQIPLPLPEERKGKNISERSNCENRILEPLKNLKKKASEI